MSTQVGKKRRPWMQGKIRLIDKYDTKPGPVKIYTRAEINEYLIQKEGATTIPKGSRSQARSKRKTS